MDLLLKQSCHWLWRQGLLLCCCFLCSGSASGAWKVGDNVLPAHWLQESPEKPVSGTIMQFSRCQAQKGDSNTGQPKRTIHVLYEGSSVYFSWVPLFSRHGNRLHSDLLWKPSFAYKIRMLFSPFILLCHSAPFFCFDYRGSNRAFAAVPQKQKIIYQTLLD